jgi:hypothetical protein
MNKLIHHCTVIYLALIILIRMMAMPISLMGYSFNKNFIAKNLCENRFRSEAHCAGKCYLVNNWPGPMIIKTRRTIRGQLKY